MKAIITTSANPLHYGHIELYNTAQKIFGRDNVKIVIGKNENKLTTKDSIEYHLVPYNIKWEIIYNTTLADYCAKNGIDYIVRGIRNGTDAEYELRLDFFNKEINKNLHTIFLPAKDIYNKISSSSICELIKYNKLDIVGKYMDQDSMYRYINGAPSYLIYFGQSCVGKTTYLNKIYKNPINIDILFWQALEDIYGKKEKDWIRDESKKVLKDQTELNNLIQKYSNKTFWDTLFNLIHQREPEIISCNQSEIIQNKTLFVLDFAAIGCYWNTIPIENRSKFYLIKITNNQSNIQKYINKKNFNNKISILNKCYIDPPYYDALLDLSKIS